MLGDEIDLSAHEEEFRAAALDVAHWLQVWVDREVEAGRPTPCYSVAALERFRQAAGGVTPRNGEGGEG